MKADAQIQSAILRKREWNILRDKDEHVRLHNALMEWKYKRELEEEP